MKKILLLLLLILITKISIHAQTYSVSNTASGYIYIGTKGSLSHFVDEDGNALPSWTGGYNIRIPSGKNVYIGNNLFDSDVVIDTLFVDGTINNTAYRTTVHFGTIIVSGSGNFNADNHSGGRLYVNVQDIVLEEGAEFAVPAVGSNSYSGLSWSGSISVADNVTLSTNGATNNLISLSQINNLPGANPRIVTQGTLEAVATGTNSIILNGNTTITADLSASDVNIYTEGFDLIIANAISQDVTLFTDEATNNSPTVDLTFGGTSSGIITIAPTNNRVRSLTMNTSSSIGISLGYPLEIVNNNYNLSALTLTDGILITTEVNVLTLNEFSFITNAVYSWNGHSSGGSNDSFIQGPIAKELDNNIAMRTTLSISGNDFFLMFPVGKGNTLREGGIGIPTTDSKTTFRVEYINNKHSKNRDIHHTSTVSLVSEVEYWNIDRITGATSAAVVLTYNAGSGIDNNHILNAQVMHFNGSNWEDQGNQSQHTVGEDVGALMSHLATSFSPFTLGGSNDHDLPVELTYFEGKKNDDGTISLYWETATEINNSHFEILASKDGRTFEKVGKVEGYGNSNTVIEYNFEIEQNNVSAYKWYRLKQVDFDGAFEFSKTIKIHTESIISNELNIFPIPAQGTIHANIISNDEIEVSYIYIYNSYGMIVKEVNFNEINNINISSLVDGVYFLNVITKNGLKETKRFIVKN